MGELAKTGRTLVVTQNYFGLGPDVKAALKSARGAGWNGRGPVLAYHFADPKITRASVDPMGNVEWEWDDANNPPTDPITKTSYANAKNASAGVKGTCSEVKPA